MSNSAWGTNTDMAAIAHGPVGCGVFTQSTRDVLPFRVQGVESFSELHFSTDLDRDELAAEAGGSKLACALNELAKLFPLAKGTLVLSEDPVGLVHSDLRRVAREKSEETDKFIIALPCESYHSWGVALNLEEEAANRRASARLPKDVSTPYDVALTFMRPGNGLAWIVARLLTDVGLNVLHQYVGSSAAEMGRVTRSKLSIGFAPMLDVPLQHLAGGAARQLEKWFGVPVQWTCFAGPSSTDASLRAVAAHFDLHIQARAEKVITEGRALVEAIITKYRPRLEGRLVVHFHAMTDEQLEPFRLLGLRIGNADGWQGERGAWRTPRVICDRDNPTDKSVDALLAEAKPDLVLHGGRDEWEWLKRGQQAFRQSPICAGSGENLYWGYDGFACFAAELDRLINAPWRKLVTPPWAADDG